MHYKVQSAFVTKHAGKMVTRHISVWQTSLLLVTSRKRVIKYIITVPRAVCSKSEISYGYFRSHCEATTLMVMHMSTGYCQTREMPSENSSFKWFPVLLNKNVAHGFKV